MASHGATKMENGTVAWVAVAAIFVAQWRVGRLHGLQSRPFLWLNGEWNVGWAAVAAIFICGDWANGIRISPIEFGRMILSESSLRASFSGGLGFAQPPATQEDSCGIIGGDAARIGMDYWTD